MKNIKFGFEFAIGYTIGRSVLHAVDLIMRGDPQVDKVKEQWKRFVSIVHAEKSESEPEINYSCKNKIGFSAE